MVLHWYLQAYLLYEINEGQIRWFWIALFYDLGGVATPKRLTKLDILELWLLRRGAVYTLNEKRAFETAGN